MFHPPDILSANDNAQEPSTQAEAEFALHFRVSTALAPRHSHSAISPSPKRHLNPLVPFPPHPAYNKLVSVTIDRLDHYLLQTVHLGLLLDS
jgi:hypothetical protein